MLREGRAGLLLLSLSALSLLNAAAPLNPKVNVVKHPTTPVPSECEEGLAPQPAPRIDLAPVPEAPSPASMEAPPSASLRDLLRATQNAAAGHDRDAFNNSLARVKAILQSYPPGGERSVADDDAEEREEARAGAKACARKEERPPWRTCALACPANTNGGAGAGADRRGASPPQDRSDDAANCDYCCKYADNRNHRDNCNHALNGQHNVNGDHDDTCKHAVNDQPNVNGEHDHNDS